MTNKKAVSLSHIPNTFNYGSAMMAITLIKGLYERSKGSLDFYVDAWDSENLSRPKESTGIDEIFSNEKLTRNSFSVWME